MSQAIDSATADFDLLASLRRGEMGALEALAERYGSKIYRLAFGVTRNQADAEEVLQDVLLTLARKGGSFEGRSALGSWLYRITTNAALNKRRGKRLELETPLEDLLPTFKADGPAIARSSSPTGHRTPRKSSSPASGAACSSGRSTVCRTTIARCSSCGTSRASPTRAWPRFSTSQSRR